MENNNKVPLTASEQVMRVIYGLLAVGMIVMALTDHRKWVPLGYVCVAFVFGMLCLKIGKQNQTRRPS